MQDKAFELVFREHNRMVTAYLHTLTRDWGVALDLTQEVFVVAYRKLDEFDPTKSVGAWLRGIARNLARNALRREFRRREFLWDGNEIDHMFACFDQAADPAAGGGPWEDRLQALHACMARLPGRQRKVIDLFYRLGQKARQIAASLGIQEQTVFRLACRARQSLRVCIENLTRQGEAVFDE
ncbi:MAG: sigma-70 family RNA polymerase sigma factor [Kiritimatiellae bacterium]|nr:sigma-70 family RNA polymerase sigma factor [Kiritimatiellia bacterium]